jgi:tRNA threonylcarbamoyladenosine biosynthesis protein TsaB
MAEFAYMVRRLMRVLAIDTSTLTGSVALLEEGAVVAEALATVRANHSESLLPMLDVTLSRAGRSMRDVDLVAVGLGPGSFTGVRIGMSIAKGLRVATGVRVAGVESLDAVIAQALGVRGFLAAVIDARRDEVFAKLVRVGDGASRTVVWPAMHASPESVGAMIRRSCGADSVTLTGDLSPTLWTRVEAGLGAPSERLPRIVGTPLARFVAWEAMQGRCVFDDDDALEPTYVRPSDAKLPVGVG